MTKVYLRARDVGRLSPMTVGPRPESEARMAQERDLTEIWDSAPFYKRPAWFGMPRAKPAPRPVVHEHVVRVKHGKAVRCVVVSTRAEALRLIERLPAGTTYSLNSVSDWRIK